MAQCFGLYILERMDLSSEGAGKSAPSSKAQQNGSDHRQDELLAIAGHEMRAHLTGILALARRLSDAPICAEQLDYVRTIRASTEAMLGTLDDFLAFSGIE